MELEPSGITKKPSERKLLYQISELFDANQKTSIHWWDDGKTERKEIRRWNSFYYTIK